MATLLLGAAVALGSPSPAQKDGAPKAPDYLALASENAKEMLLLMDTNRNGKISKQEWMDFMAAEFDRLDIHKSGELDPRELMQSSVTVRRVRPQDAGK